MFTPTDEPPEHTNTSIKTSNFITKLRLHLHDKSHTKNTELLMRGLISNAIKEQNFRRMQKIDYSKSIEELFIDEIKKPISTLNDLPTNISPKGHHSPHSNDKPKKRLSLILNQTQPEKRNVEVSHIYILTMLDDYICITKL